MHRDVLVHPRSDRLLNLLAQQGVEQLDHAHEAAAEHDQADDEENHASPCVPYVGALRPEHVEKETGVVLLAGLEDCYICTTVFRVIYRPTF